MLLNLHKKSWMQGLTLQNYQEHCQANEDVIKNMLQLAKNYHKVNIMDTLQYFFDFSKRHHVKRQHVKPSCTINKKLWHDKPKCLAYIYHFFCSLHFQFEIFIYNHTSAKRQSCIYINLYTGCVNLNWS